MSDRDPAGLGLCWCPDEMTLRELRVVGHRPDCTRARRGWQKNMENLSELARQKRIDEEVGRQLREAATAALAAALEKEAT